jgi:signal transduction histidine kinase
MTDKTAQLIEKAYKSFVDLMLSSREPVDQLDRVAVKDIMGYGTALDEEIHDINGLKELAIIQREQSADMKLQYELTPVFRKMIHKGDSVIIVDKLIIYMQVKDEQIALNLRLSTVMEFIDGQWKVVHWHGSKPEYDSGGTDTWHKEEWKQKNEELQRMVDEKTADLEMKNHELALEAALERVRTAAMAMQQPDDMVEVCKIISEQLITLGVNEIRNVQTAIVNEQKGTYLNYQYFAAYEEGVIEDTDYNKHPTVLEMVTALRKSKDAFFTGYFEGEELKAFREWRIRNDQFPDPLLDKAKSVHYYFYSIGEGGLGLSTYKPITDKELDIFKRFHSVFSLAYRRFIDIEQAETQALEAELDLIRLKEEKRKTEEALAELKTTQAQLIHAEKMASLGELTAGIAHEIQNPLNFVNNFSEVSAELVDEMKQELAVGSWQSAVGGQRSAVSGQQSAIEILDDIRQNLDKILHHGKRADAIVKGMLQHSRTSTGQKEPTDINALADEYLRLSYHGLRAKDKTFNAVLKTDFDPDLPKVAVVPQDIGRVLLNLINNAFYAVSNRNLSGLTTLTGSDNKMAPEAYKPTVTVSTKRTLSLQGESLSRSIGSWGEVLIIVHDNGNGIPDEIKDKIFQPFFTTKPTGQGTGLGLSLSYDIVKAHGGELKVESKEGEGSEFIILLPVT